MTELSRDDRLDAILLILNKIYDVQMGMLSEIDHETYDEVERVHESGGLIYPNHFFLGDDSELFDSPPEDNPRQ